MTIELAIENDIVESLESEIKDYKIEAFSGDYQGTFDRAQKQNLGLIVVAHSQDSATYDIMTRNMTTMTLPFAINILSNDRRSQKGLYEILDRVRNLMLRYSFLQYQCKVIAHQMLPNKYPTETGIFVGEINIEIKVDLYNVQRYLNEN